MRYRQFSRILIVDDDPASLNLLMKILGTEYKVKITTDGWEALEIASSKNPPDLILLDIMMPEIDGYDVCRRLKANEKTKDIPVIFLTGKGDYDAETEGFTVGAVDFIRKPFSMPVIKSRIRTQMEIRNQRNRLEMRARELDQALKALDIRNQFIRRTFGRYLTDDVVDNILETPEGMYLGGERREVTIVMSDLRGFSTIAERLKAEETVSIINCYLEVMTEIIIKHRGTIDEFIGDAILVIFGAPVLRGDDADRAVACALEMQIAMEEVNKRNKGKGYPGVEQGIGINTGPVVVGNIGSPKRVKYGVVGSNVNLTSRIQSFTHSGQILISKKTLEVCGSALKTTGEMEIPAKGIDTPITIYELQGIGGEYDITLPERKEIELIDLPRPLPVTYEIMTKNVIVGNANEGTLLRLKGMVGEIQTTRRFRQLTHLKITLYDESGNKVAGHIYAMVRKALSQSPAVSRITFTSITPEARLFLENLEDTH